MTNTNAHQDARCDARDLALIEEELAERFPKSNALSEAMRKKLALCIYKKEHCVALLGRARRAMNSMAWSQASVTQKAEFRNNLQQTQDRISELNGLIRNYISALDQADRLLQNQ